MPHVTKNFLFIAMTLSFHSSLCTKNTRPFPSRANIFTAAAQGDTESFKSFVEEKCNFKFTDENGNTPLHVAAKNGQTKIMEMLIQEEDFLGRLWHWVWGMYPDINAQNANGETATHLTIGDEKNDEKPNALELLLKKNAKTIVYNKDNSTPLLLATEQGKTYSTLLLAKHDPNYHRHTKNGANILKIAILKGHLQLAEKLLTHESLTQLITDENPQGLTILADIVANNDENNAAVLTILLQNKTVRTTINNQKNQKAMPLHIATQNNKYQFAQKLIDNGHANINAQDRNGNTPLLNAIEQNNYQAVEWLLNNKADITIPNKKNHSALNIAKNNLPLVDLLISHGANINETNSLGRNHLMLHLENGDESIIKHLMKHGADSDCIDKYGNTAAHLAVTNKNITALLPQFIKDIHATNNAGETLIHCAAQTGNDDAIKFLINNDASLDSYSKIGNTPAHDALINNHFSCITLLTNKKTINMVNGKKQTLFHIALEKKTTVEFLNNLIDSGTDLQLTIDNNGYQHYAAFYNNCAAFKMLHQHYGLSINKRNNNGDTALHLAARNGNTDLINYIISYDADLTKENDKGETPLVVAALNNHINAVKMLVSDKDFRNGRVKTILKKIDYSWLHCPIVTYLKDQQTIRAKTIEQLSENLNQLHNLYEVNKQSNQLLQQKTTKEHAHLSYSYIKPDNTILSYSKKELSHMSPKKRAHLEEAIARAIEREKKEQRIIQSRMQSIDQYNHEQENKKQYEALLKKQAQEKEELEQVKKLTEELRVQQQQTLAPEDTSFTPTIPIPSAPSLDQEEQKTIKEDNDEQYQECHVCYEEKADAKPVPCNNCKASKNLCSSCLAGMIARNNTKCPYCTIPMTIAQNNTTVHHQAP